ncbi:hypothetical protein KY327_02790 [Candidatus Woesearchaeota archaeon]|nr:hypothetical protein [Candidatus Woesearchaeota archaeon]
MKRPLLIMIGVLAMALLVAGCTPQSSTGESCEQAGGEWLPTYGECEGVSKSWCSEQGGSFDQCASACRHDPDADVCTLQCVPVCSFGE